VTGGTPTYAAVHVRLRTLRGPAREHPCVTCGQQAAQWAYGNAAPDELVNDGGQRYSPDPDHYSPMCTGCHAAFDTAPTAAHKARIADHIRRVVDEAPEFTGPQRARLAALLSGGASA
jgi:hypothetical protein